MCPGPPSGRRRRRPWPGSCSTRARGTPAQDASAQRRKERDEAADGDVLALRLEVLRGAVLERDLATRVRLRDVRARDGLEDLLLADVADRGRVRERRRARHGRLDVLEREDLVGVAGLAGQELERRRVVRRDVVAEVEARRAAGDGEALVGRVVEAARTGVSEVRKRGRRGRTACWRSGDSTRS
jgi:hypothetical protein